MRIVLDPTGMRRAASRLDDAAAEAAITATRLTATSLPTMPPSVAALVSDAVQTTQRTARAASLELHDLASELRLRARLGELAGDGNGWPSVLRTSGAWLGEGPSGIFGQAGLAWALVAGWDGYHLADNSDSVIPSPTTSGKPKHSSGLIGDLEKAAHVAPAWVASHVISFGGSAVAVKGVVVRDVGGPFMSMATREIPYATRLGIGAAAGAAGQLISDASKNLSAEARAGRALVAASAGGIATATGIVVGGVCETGSIAFTAGTTSVGCWALGAAAAGGTGWAINHYVAPKVDHAAGWEPRPNRRTSKSPRPVVALAR